MSNNTFQNTLKPIGKFTGRAVEEAINRGGEVLDVAKQAGGKLVGITRDLASEESSAVTSEVAGVIADAVDFGIETGKKFKDDYSPENNQLSEHIANGIVKCKTGGRKVMNWLSRTKDNVKSRVKSSKVTRTLNEARKTFGDKAVKAAQNAAAKVTSKGGSKADATAAADQILKEAGPLER